MSNKHLIAMIPARMGSKRIPKKCVRFMLDKPLIQYPIDFALASGAFESVWVNTESEELGHICEKMGARFHPRPAELATDTATNREFTYEFLQKHKCDYVVMMNPTSPALRQETVDAFLKYVNDNDFDTVLSVSSLKAETFYKDEALNFDVREKINSQLLTPVEPVVWALTAWKRETFLRLQDEGACPVFGGKLGRFVIPKDETPDLDTEEDWRIAEAILEARRKHDEDKVHYMI